MRRGGGDFATRLLFFRVDHNGVIRAEISLRTAKIVSIGGKKKKESTKKEGARAWRERSKNIQREREY